MGSALKLKNTQDQEFAINHLDNAGAISINSSDIATLSGNQTVTGEKTFTSSPIVPTPTAGDNSTKIATTAFVLSNGVPPGTVISIAQTTTPTGYLKCNGALISRTTYADLFAAIGTTFGAGDGSTTFALPDLRGEFIRGWDDGRGIDTNRSIGSYQADAFQGHKHNINSYGNSAGSTSLARAATTTSWDTALISTPISDGVNGTPRTDIETRPRNIALLYCIKY